MENTVLEQANVTDNGENQEERTFTQKDVDEIVKSRIAKEKAKYGDYETLMAKASKFDEMEEANKSELQKATEKAEELQRQVDELNRTNVIRAIRDKVSADTGIPASLLHGDTEEDCIEQAKALVAFKNESQKYPSVKDGGEVQKVQHKTVEDQFADWFNKSINT